jgi:hypothetical protein
MNIREDDCDSPHLQLFGECGEMSAATCAATNFDPRQLAETANEVLDLR